MQFVPVLALALVPFASPQAEPAQDGDDPVLVDATDGEEDPFDWQLGPCEARLGDRAVLQVPAGFRFTGGEGTRVLLEAMQNPTSGQELGLVASDDEALGYFVVFEFDESGYVEDTDRDDLDADELLDVLKEGNRHGNELRERRGWEKIDLVGWQREPFYDPRTNNLTWATLLRSGTHETVNWSVRVLGRHGVMNVDLVLAPDQLEAALPGFEQLIDSFAYTDGERYAQFTAGDKVAEYGLAALVVGGGAAVAAKTGLLAKLAKPLIAVAVAIAAFAKRFWAFVTGRNREEPKPAE